ncbi:MAG TPA: 4a-hydroxytetrahydrobiopterin dehydratase [Deltaproteobacteria bacterium]|nr:4a-hydroxytetrahydrobiopterin dehydratase [Deltaproteobacteria bacterium]
MSELKSKKCVPCKGDTPKLEGPAAEKLLQELDGWEILAGKLHKTFRFKNFRQAMQFVNPMAEIAEAENHHPNFCVNYREVDVTIWTHAIDGLSENDFILAAKYDAVPRVST